MSMQESTVRNGRMAGRVREFGTTIFAEMSALARELGAVNLGQGFPDFDGPEEIKAVVREAINAGHNQYAVSHGEPELRRAIAEHSLRFYGRQIDPTQEITVTSGATEALWCSAFAFIEPGDEVIVFEPCYDSYIPAIRMAGGIPVPVTLHTPEFRFNPEELRAAISPRTRVIYLNTPHNPTGTVFSQQELAVVADICREHDLLAITDEVYEHILYDGVAHHRLATLPGMWERTLTISSGGKSFSFTGWKIGWAIGPELLQRGLRRVHQFAVFATSTPLQYGIAHALGLPDSYYAQLREDYESRRDFLTNVLEETGLQVRTPQGSYFILADIGDAPEADATEFSRRLIREIGVAAIPLETFYLNRKHGSRLIRFCFCKRWETLRAGAERLGALRI